MQNNFDYWKIITPLAVTCLTAAFTWLAILLRKSYKKITSFETTFSILKNDLETSKRNLELSQENLNSYMMQKEAECNLCISEKINEAEDKLELMLKEHKRVSTNTNERVFKKIDNNRQEIQEVTKQIYTAMSDYDVKLDGLEKSLRKSLITKGEYEKGLSNVKDNFFKELMSIQSTLTKFETQSETMGSIGSAIRRLIDINKNIPDYKNKFIAYEKKISDLLDRINTSENTNNEKHKITKNAVKSKFSEIKEEQGKVVSKMHDIIGVHKKSVQKQISELQESDREIRIKQSFPKSGKIIEKDK